MVGESPPGTARSYIVDLAAHATALVWTTVRTAWVWSGVCGSSGKTSCCASASVRFASACWLNPSMSAGWRPSTRQPRRPSSVSSAAQSLRCPGRPGCGSQPPLVSVPSSAAPGTQLGPGDRLLGVLWRADVAARAISCRGVSPHRRVPYASPPRRSLRPLMSTGPGGVQALWPWREPLRPAEVANREDGAWEAPSLAAGGFAGAATISRAFPRPMSRRWREPPRRSLRQIKPRRFEPQWQRTAMSPR